jgi:hypothetical protein
VPSRDLANPGEYGEFHIKNAVALRNGMNKTRAEAIKAATLGLLT